MASLGNRQVSAKDGRGVGNGADGAANAFFRFFVIVEAAEREGLPEFNRNMYKKFGNTFKIRLLGQHSYSTVEPRNVQALLATQFKDFGLGAFRHDVFFPLLGDGIFTLDGKGWEHSRSLLRPQFSREQISHL